LGGDGCSSDCQSIESGWECLVPGDPCLSVCGDGIILGLETCDDHSDDGIGCEIGCLNWASGFDCSSSYSNLTSLCLPMWRFDQSFWRDM